MSLPIGSSCPAYRFAAEASRGLVGRGGVEPPTSRLSGVRSNHLSYRPNPRGRASRLPQGCWWSLSPRRGATEDSGQAEPAKLVEPTGIEPVTSCLQSTRSPS